jgi:hypothetical protein
MFTKILPELLFKFKILILIKVMPYIRFTADESLVLPEAVIIPNIPTPILKLIANEYGVPVPKAGVTKKYIIQRLIKAKALDKNDFYNILTKKYEEFLSKKSMSVC